MNSNAATLRAFFARIWNSRDFGAIPEFLAPVYEVRSDPGDAWHGQTLDHAGFLARIRKSMAPVPDLEFTIVETVAQRDRVAVSWTMSGTHQGPLGPSGGPRRFEDVPGLTIYSFTDGKISGHWQVVDRMGLMRQFGLLPSEPPASQGTR
ncbi:MAG TPA: ester cyclase [Planctomycetota bacterium]